MDIVIVFEILIAFFLKMADNILGTVKTIYLTKGKPFKAAAFAGFSTLFYLIAIVRIANSNSIWSIIAMCFATFLGTLIPCVFFNRSERERLYIFDITANTLDAGKQFADILRSENIAVTTSSVYARNMEKTLLCKVYCSSKEDSRFVQSLLDDHKEFKYHIYTPIEED